MLLCLQNSNIISGFRVMMTTIKAMTKSTVGVSLSVLMTSYAQSQSGSLNSEYPELASLYNAFDVTQAGIYDAIEGIGSDPASEDGRMELKMHLDMMANMDHGGHGGHGGGMMMDMDGHFGQLETDARIALGELVRGNHSLEQAESAFENSSALTERAAKVLAHGRSFERNIWNIFSNDSTTIYQKQMAIEEAVQEYRNSEPTAAVSLSPKTSRSLSWSHLCRCVSNGFSEAGGLLYANQWLQLASLEAIIIGQVDPQFGGRVPLTMERYWNKVGSDTGMTMFPAPTEMPSAPAISPQLYSQAPQAAIIIDNLNMLESALADVVAYPNLQDRETVIDQVVAQYTSDDMHLAETMEYLLNALRGGIFNQGGPAIGDLSRSERNRSRDAMNMNHTMIMSAPN